MREPQDSELMALACRLTAFGAERTEQSSERSFLNAERNLAVVVHAAVALVSLGFAIARYQLYANYASGPAAFRSHFIIETMTNWSAAGQGASC